MYVNSVPSQSDWSPIQQARFILLTGPNMVGKSTLVRQVCLAVILAQMYLQKALKYLHSIVVFFRMGARDHVLAGQSTCLTELLETASMLVFRYAIHWGWWHRVRDGDFADI